MHTSRFQELRTALYHLRTGGVKQYREWQRREFLKRDYTALHKGESAEPPAFDKLPHPAPRERKKLMDKAFASLRVATVFDDLTAQLWDPEFEQVRLQPNKWRRQLNKDRVDFLLVGSDLGIQRAAWARELAALLNFAKDKAIPTVFWDTEHCLDAARRQLNLARLFDVVFTVDATRNPEYRRALGHHRVFHLPWAVQPKIHNPIKAPGLYHQSDIGAVAHPTANTDSVGLKTLIAMEERKTLTDLFPSDYRHLKMVSAYRAFKVFLDVTKSAEDNRVIPPRLMEAIVSGTPAAAMNNEAVTELFTPNEVPIIADPEAGALVLEQLLANSHTRDTMAQNAQRKVWQDHTYTHRTLDILHQLGLAHRPRRTLQPLVSVVLCTNRPRLLARAIESAGRQRYENLQLVFVANGYEPAAGQVKRIAAQHGLTDVITLTTPKEASLGASLNAGIRAADGEVIAKFDDDDFYGVHYLEDQVNALHFSEAQIVGKQARFIYLGEEDTTRLRHPEFENTYTTHVAGATLVAPKEVFERYPFPEQIRGEDTQFLKRIMDDGGLIYSADRFNFLQIRGKYSHTWNVTEGIFVDKSQLVAPGYHPELVLTTENDDDSEYLAGHPHLESELKES